MKHEFREIKEADIPDLKYQLMDWDVVIGDEPYQVIKAPGFVHTYGGQLDYGEGNCYWAYPLGEPMSEGNLIGFCGKPGACFGMVYTPINRVRSKWDDTYIEDGRKLCITRNGEPFYEGPIGFHEAIAYLKDGKIDDHPLDLHSRNYDTKCIDRKVWWSDQPAVIKRFVKGRACVVLVPEEGERFKCPAFLQGEDKIWWEEENAHEVLDSIFSKDIYWFR